MNVQSRRQPQLYVNSTLTLGEPPWQSLAAAFPSLCLDRYGWQLLAARRVGVLVLAQAWLFLCVLQGSGSPNWHLLRYS